MKSEKFKNLRRILWTRSTIYFIENPWSCLFKEAEKKFTDRRRAVSDLKSSYETYLWLRFASTVGQTRHVFVKHGCPRRQVKIWQNFQVLHFDPHPTQGHVMLVRCKQLLDKWIDIKCKWIDVRRHLESECISTLHEIHLARICQNNDSLDNKNYIGRHEKGIEIIFYYTSINDNDNTLFSLLQI